MEFVTDFESSNIAKFGYDADTKYLEITFHSGASYAYENVPLEIFEGMKEAESKGKYFHANIRGQFPYVKLEKIV